MNKWVAGLKQILVVVVALVVGLISLLTIQSSKQGARDKILKEELEQQIERREKIDEAIKKAPTTKEEALKYLKDR